MTIDTGIKNKKILLMGACGILGRVHTNIMLEQQARLIIADQPGSDVLELSETLRIKGVEIDVTSENDVITGVEKAFNFYGGIDGAVFNVAITGEALVSTGNVFPDFEEYPLSLWQRAIDVNLTGAFLFAREVGNAFKNNGGGTLVNVSSIYGVVAPDHRIYDNQSFSSFPAYSASKAGIIGLSRWLSTWWGKENIRVNTISPGGVYNNHNEGFNLLYSERTPMGRMANPEDITGILIYLLSDSSRYCTGQNFTIDGGLTAW